MEFKEIDKKQIAKMSDDKKEQRLHDLKELEEVILELIPRLKKIVVKAGKDIRYLEKQIKIKQA